MAVLPMCYVEGEDYVISKPSLVALRLDPILINITLLHNDRGGGEAPEYIDVTLVQDEKVSPVEEFRVLVRPTVRITIPGSCIVTS